MAAPVITRERDERELTESDKPCLKKRRNGVFLRQGFFAHTLPDAMGQCMSKKKVAVVRKKELAAMQFNIY